MDDRIHDLNLPNFEGFLQLEDPLLQRPDIDLLHLLHNILWQLFVDNVVDFLLSFHVLRDELSHVLFTGLDDHILIRVFLVEVVDVLLEVLFQLCDLGLEALFEGLETGLLVFVDVVIFILHIVYLFLHLLRAVLQLLNQLLEGSKAFSLRRKLVLFDVYRF
jgi:hypothetical protein